MLELVVTVDEVTPTLTVMVEKLGDLTKPLTTVLADGLFSAQEQVFEGKGALFGGPRWDAMAPRTIAKGRDPATLLVETGGLLSSLSRGSEGNSFEVGPTEGEAGTSLVSPRNSFPYAAQQQLGNQSYPSRPYLAWYEERFSDYDLVFLDWFFSESEA